MSRIHRSAAVGKAQVDTMVTWTDPARIEDVEEAIKASARAAISAARDTFRGASS